MGWRDSRPPPGSAPRSQPAVAAAVVPAEYLGVTFTYDPETDEYGPSELPGAPADGVRFIVYSVNPINGLPTEPLVEVGYADIVTTESANAASVRVELVSNAITYLDYTVAFTGSSTEITMAVSGFVSNGEDRVDFDLDNQASSTAISVDYVLTVPTRDGFRLAIELDASESVATVNIDVRGAHGRVEFSGSVTDGAGTVDIEVNGELFATMTVTLAGRAGVHRRGRAAAERAGARSAAGHLPGRRRRHGLLRGSDRPDGLIEPVTEFHHSRLAGHARPASPFPRPARARDPRPSGRRPRRRSW